MILVSRRTATVDAGSRAFTDAALRELRAARWSPAGWARFTRAVTVRAVEQIIDHRRAAVEVSVLHGLFLFVALRRGRGRWWVASSWALAVTHLGLLGRRRTIGWPNAVTLARANLPVTGGPLGRWVGVAALASDKLDGTLARRQGPTMFGFYADSLADAAFWTWFSTRDRSRLVTAAGVAAWVAPMVAVGAASIAKGEMVAGPRPALLRPAAAMQAILAVRALRARHLRRVEPSFGMRDRRNSGGGAPGSARVPTCSVV